MMVLNELKKKKILILGFGKEGIDSFLFLRKLFPKKTLGIADQKIYSIFYDRRKKGIGEKRGKVRLHLGKNYLKALKDYDVIIKSPGVPIHLPKVEKAFEKSSFAQGYGGRRITSQTEIFFENCPGKIIGITGTKGKSTTTSLIYQILKKGGFQAHLVGNIGKPVLSLLLSATPKDIYVFELSAHQLYNLRKSPQIAVFLNIYPEHLDYYKNLKEYARAKANITLHQTKKDYLIFNKEDKIVSGFARKSKAQKIPISIKKISKSVEFYDTCRKSQLKGDFNLLNMAAAIEVGKIFKIPKEKIKKAVKEFKPLPHRLELVGIFKGITFYNDALSTIPETAIFALDALGDRVETIMLGGFDRKIDFKNLAKRVSKSKIKNVILFPTTGEKIWKEILKISKNRGLPRHFFVDPIRNRRLSNGADIMKDAVKIAYQNTKKGKICLLSCASTSFSIFRDYKEKGDLFRKYVKQFSRK